MQEPDSRPKHCVRDIVVVGVLLWLFNRLTAPHDVGWIALNPTPWLLLPVLIGSRYGIIPGLSAGVTASLAITLMHSRHTHKPAIAFAQEHPFYFTALILGGLLAGEVNRLHRAKNRDLGADHARLSDQNERLAAELELARETKQDLQRHLALLNAPIASLDDDLRKLITSPPSQLMAGVLSTVHQHARVTSAAFYKREGSGELRRLAALYPTKPLAERLLLDEVPLALEAMNNSTISVISDPLQTTEKQPFLAALPWATAKDSGVLLVQEMAFEAFGAAGLARLQLITDWAFSLSRYREDLHQTATPITPMPFDAFLAQVGSALEAEKNHCIPSVVLRVEFLNHQEASRPQAERQLLKVLPPASMCSRLSNNGSLVILLPFAGETEALALGQALSAAGPQVRVAHYLIVGPVTLNDFWAHVMLP